MASTLLQLMQRATNEMGLGAPSLVVGSTSADTVQQLALINAVGYELSRQFDWQALGKEYRFTTQFLTTTGTITSGSAVITNLGSTVGVDTTYMVVGTGINQDTYVNSVDSGTQVTMSQNATASGTVTINFSKTKYSFPSDYDRPISRSQWDKTKHWEMLGPETPQQWQFLKSGYISTGPRVRFRSLGNFFQIWPAITTAEYLGFEYISNNWVISSTSTSKTSFTADTDTCIFPDNLMVLGLKLKYFEVKNFDTTAFARDFTMQLDIAKANDSGAKTLSLAPQVSEILISQQNLPDSGIGL